MISRFFEALHQIFTICVSFILQKNNVSSSFPNEIRFHCVIPQQHEAKRPLPVTQPPCPQASRRELAEGYALEAPEETAEMTAIGRACLSLPFDLSNLASLPTFW